MSASSRFPGLELEQTWVVAHKGRQKVLQSRLTYEESLSFQRDSCFATNHTFHGTLSSAAEQRLTGAAYRTKMYQEPSE